MHSNVRTHVRARGDSVWDFDLIQSSSRRKRIEDQQRAPLATTTLQLAPSPSTWEGSRSLTYAITSARLPLGCVVTASPDIVAHKPSLLRNRSTENVLHNAITCIYMWNTTVMYHKHLYSNIQQLHVFIQSRDKYMGVSLTLFGISKDVTWRHW